MLTYRLSKEISTFGHDKNIMALLFTSTSKSKSSINYATNVFDYVKIQDIKVYTSRTTVAIKLREYTSLTLYSSNKFITCVFCKDAKYNHVYQEHHQQDAH